LAVEGVGFDVNVMHLQGFDIYANILHGFGSELYGRELVDLRNERRWEFLNTLFSISESVMFMQVYMVLYRVFFPSCDIVEISK